MATLNIQMHQNLKVNLVDTTQSEASIIQTKPEKDDSGLELLKKETYQQGNTLEAT